jgi:Icc-related predicted phosphoesterase
MRIAALSDLHGYLPDIPSCDLLILAGDLCPDRVGSSLCMQDPRAQRAWFDRSIPAWVEKSGVGRAIATWGNHDWCGEQCASSDDGAEGKRLQILVDAQTTVRTPDGEEITIWATPWSNQFMHWAFMKTPAELARVYAAIPAGIDILVSHQPAFGYGDTQADRTQHFGSHELLAAIERVKPRVVVCGHFHEGHGRYEHQGIPLYNVSVVDDYYRLTHPVTLIELG